MRTDKFEKEIRNNCLFEKESVDARYIHYAHELRRYDVPDEQIIQMLTDLYNKSRNDRQK